MIGESDFLKDLVTKETFLKECPELASDGRVRWWVRHRHNNGAADAGAIIVIGRRAFFHPKRMAQWILDQDKRTGE